MYAKTWHTIHRFAIDEALDANIDGLVLVNPLDEDSFVWSRCPHRAAPDLNVLHVLQLLA